jgi:hypothetical protein
MNGGQLAQQELFQASLLKLKKNPENVWLSQT